MKKIENMEQFLDSMANYNPKFDDGFSDRIIGKLDDDQKDTSNSFPEFVRLFRWVSLSGVAAIIILLITIYTTEGSFDLDAIYGIFNFSPDNPVLASLDY